MLIHKIIDEDEIGTLKHLSNGLLNSLHSELIRVVCILNVYSLDTLNVHSYHIDEELAKAVYSANTKTNLVFCKKLSLSSFFEAPLANFLCVK